MLYSVNCALLKYSILSTSIKAQYKLPIPVLIGPMTTLLSVMIKISLETLNGLEAFDICYTVWHREIACVAFKELSSSTKA